MAFRAMVAAMSVLLMALIQHAVAQLEAGTTEVPIPRRTDCSNGGPSTYVYRMSSVKANDYFPDVCPTLGGVEVHFNDPCRWANGLAQMTVAHFTKMCKGATRTIHWHSDADEWGYVKKGQLQTYVASPDGLPWEKSDNILSPGGVWYFPTNWLHGLLCLTPESEGGCEFWIAFASPQAAEPNGHNLDTTLAQAPDDIAAAALGIDVSTYRAMRPAFQRAEGHGDIKPFSPIVTPLAPGVCDPHCPPIQETRAAPAAQEAAVSEVSVTLTEGVTVHQIRTRQFPFARTMSQERTELAAGARRPLVWVSADAVLLVISGSVVVGLEGGIPGADSHRGYVNNTIAEGDVAYFPNGRAYWFVEATGAAPAVTVTVFNVGNWKSFEFGASLKLMPKDAVLSNIHVAKIPPAFNVPSSAESKTMHVGSEGIILS